MKDFLPINSKNLENTTTNLEAIIAEGGLADRKLGTLVSHNLGHNTLTMTVPMHQFFDMSEVANERNILEKGYQEQEIAQRPLDRKHAERLAVYILKGMVNATVQQFVRQGASIPNAVRRIQKALGMQPYLALQPIVCNIRGVGFGGTSGLRFEAGADGPVYVYLSNKHVLWVIDGQHRRMAFAILFEYLRQLLHILKYPKRPVLFPSDKLGEKLDPDEAAAWNYIFEVGRTLCTVTVEVHLGLDAKQERQLFHDLNNLVKKVEGGLAFKYDQGNAINQWIKDVLVDEGILSAQVVDRDVNEWDKDSGVIARKDLVSVNAILFLNKTNVNAAVPEDVTKKEDVAKQFWAIISAIDGFGEKQAKQNTIAAQPVVLKALAKLTYDCAFGRDSNNSNNLLILFTGLEQGKIDFSHDNALWRYYQLTDEQRRDFGLTGLKEYLPSEEKGNRDIGAYTDSTKLMRFGSKHNDIAPILGDMIRWKLGLPNRNSKEEQQAA